MKLEGKVAIVTGGGQGIGRGIALRYGKEGASVVVADIQQDQAQKVADEIKAAGGKAVAVTVDVRKQDQVQAMVETAVREFGGRAYVLYLLPEGAIEFTK